MSEIRYSLVVPLYNEEAVIGQDTCSIDDCP